MALLEVACFSPENAILAFQAGADRIELCHDREAGGTTPPYEWLPLVNSQVTIPIYVMIRPRGGDFHYSDEEFDQMRADIDRFKPEANGYVFGILDIDKKVDTCRTAELVERARPLPCTFHRALDETADLFEAFEDVISTGCKAVLSSGGASSASGGVEMLGQMIRMSTKRITVIPGGGVRSKNVSEVQGFTKASIMHSSACLRGKDEPDVDEIRRLKALLQRHNHPLPESAGRLSPEMVSQKEEHVLLETMRDSAVSIGSPLDMASPIEGTTVPPWQTQ